MSYHLEQGVYFLAHSAFETTSGLGLRAASLKDRESVQAMCAAASRLDLYSERTEYSFLYNSRLGFALAATTTRMPAGEKRRTPYIHMIFSGRHPHDAPEDYGFRAVYETGERDVFGLVGQAEVDSMPPWNLRNLPREQLAWLIRKLWNLLSFRSGDDQPLLLSPDSLPQEGDPPLRLAQLMCALAELIPPFFRSALSGTTAAPAAGGVDAFPVHLSASPNAYRLDSLPTLERNDPEDYFKSFCLKMAQAYQESPRTFQLITDRVDQGGLARLRQPTAERQMLAACCALMEWQPPWCLERAALSALQKRVQSMLPNQREDQAFWEEQVQLLGTNIPPDDLPELLKWFEQEQKSLEDQKSFLMQNYLLSRERFCRQSSCLKDGPEDLLVFLWEWPNVESILDGWEPEGMESPGIFYPYLAEQLRFWEDMPLRRTEADKALGYFSKRLDEGPDATLEELAPLLRKTWGLLNPDSLERRLVCALQKESRLPELQVLRDIPERFLQRASLNCVLTTLWRQEKPADAGAFNRWDESGKLLRIPNRSAILEECIRERTDSLETAQDATAFTERFLPCLSTLQVKELSRRLELLAERTETLKELEQLAEARQRIVTVFGSGYDSYALQKKLERAKLEDRLRQSSLLDLLRMVKEEPDVNANWSEPGKLWRERMRLCLEALGETDSMNLAPEDIRLLNDAAWVLGREDPDLTHKLCCRFLCECYPRLGNLASIRSSYMNLLGEDIRRYAQQQADQCTLAELYEYECANPVYQVHASLEAWANLAGRDRAEICVRIFKDVEARRIYKTLWILEDPFCTLLRRLYDQTYQCVPFNGDEIGVLLDCLAGLTAMLPEEKGTMEKLLKLWQQNPTSPNLELCLELIRRMEQVSPRRKNRQVKCALKCWKTAFHNKGQRELLEEAWKRRRKKWDGPFSGTFSPAKDTGRRTPAEDEPPPKTGDTALKKLDGLLARGDALIEGVFYRIGLVFRSPILLARLLLRKLMR